MASSGRGSTVETEETLDDQETHISPTNEHDELDVFDHGFGGLDHLNRNPRGRLKAVASGEAQLKIEDIESLLTDHVLDADAHAKELGKTCSQLVEFMFSDQKADPTATLSLIKDLSSLSRASSEEMRKSIELLSRIRRQPPPRVQVVSVDGQVNVASQQVNADSVKLGDR
jgi:hypothetical protein